MIGTPARVGDSARHLPSDSSHRAVVLRVTPVTDALDGSVGRESSHQWSRIDGRVTC